MKGNIASRRDLGSVVLKIERAPLHGVIAIDEQQVNLLERIHKLVRKPTVRLDLSIYPQDFHPLAEPRIQVALAGFPLIGLRAAFLARSIKRSMACTEPSFRPCARQYVLRPFQLPISTTVLLLGSAFASS